MLDDKAISRLKGSASHIVIVGRFTTELTPSSRTVKFSEAKGLVKFGVFSEELVVPISGKGQYRTRVTKEPKRVQAQQVTGGSAKGMSIAGTALQQELLRLGDAATPPTPAEIGGRIVAGLFKSLDALMPFWHPNFDVLLTEGLYHARMNKAGAPLVDPISLRRVLYHLSFGRLLTNYLRAPDDDVDAIYDALANAYPGEQFRTGTASVDETRLRDSILSDIQAYRQWLQPGATSAGGAMFGVLTGGGIAEKLRVHAVPNHTNPRRTLKQVYADYRLANEDVARVARSEQLMAFVTEWYFSAFSESKDLIDVVNAAHEKLYDDTKMTSIDVEFSAELAKIYERAQWEKHNAAFGLDRSTPAARISFELTEVAVARYMMLRQPSRVFSGDELLLWLGTTFSDLATKFVNGVDAIVERSEKASVLYREAQKGIDQSFSKPASAGNAGTPPATSEGLAKILRPTFESLDKQFAALPACPDAGPLPALGLLGMLDAVLAAHADITGDELCKEMLRALAELEGQTKASIVTDPISLRRDTINADAEKLINAYVRQLRGGRQEMTAGGPTASAVNPAAGAKENEEQRKTAAAVSGMPTSIVVPVIEGGKPGNPLKPDVKGAIYQDGDAKHPGGVLNLQVPMTRQEVEALEGTEGKKVLPSAIDDAINEMLADQDLVVAKKKQIAGDNDLYRRQDQAAQRARLRALLFAEHMLAARPHDSVLDREDTSLLAKVALNTVLHVGRDEGLGTGDFSALVRPSPDDAGFAKVPIWEIVQAQDLEQARQKLADFLTYVRAQCRGVLELKTYVSEMDEVSKLLESLGRISGQGWVTFVDDTIEGIVERSTDAPLPLLEVDRDSDVPPPGVVYVTRQAAGAYADGGQPIDLDILFAKLVDPTRRGLLSKPGGGDATRLQSAEDGGKLGFPLFIGQSLQSAVLPAVSVPTPQLSGLVLCASGYRAVVPNDVVTLPARMEDELGIIVGSHESAAKVWTRLLTESPTVLRQLLQSKLVSVAIAHRQLVGPKVAGKPEYKYALFDGRSELERLLGRLPILDNGLWVASAQKWEAGTSPGKLLGVGNQFAISRTKPTDPPTEPDATFTLL